MKWELFNTFLLFLPVQGNIFQSQSTIQSELTKRMHCEFRYYGLFILFYFLSS